MRLITLILRLIVMKKEEKIMNSFENKIDKLEEKYKPILQKVGPYCESLNRGIKKAEALLRKIPRPDSDSLDNFDITDEEHPLLGGDSLKEFLIFNGENFIYSVWNEKTEAEFERKRVNQLTAKLRMKVCVHIPYYINFWMTELKSWMSKDKISFL